MNPEQKYQDIILVDDDPVFLRLLERILLSVHLKPRCFSSSRHLYELICEKPEEIGMLMADFFLPDGQFKTLIKQMKSHEDTRYIPVMAIAGKKEKDMSTVLSYVYGQDIDDFMFKPINPSEVILRCTRLLGLRETFFSLKDKMEGSNKLVSVLEKKLQDTASIYHNMQKEYHRLKEMFAQKEEYFYTLAHDMKAPLTNIILGTDLILTGDTPFSAEDREMLDKMKETGTRINGLVENFLENIKNERIGDSLQFETINPNSILEIILREFYPEANRKSVLLTLEIDENLLPVVWDQTQILRVIGNIVDNAIKYSPENQVVTITLSQNDEETTYNITDRGPGIALEDQENIFEMFYQPEQSKKGFGIGLAFSKKIVEKHGGKIQVFSKPGLGTTMRVVLPNEPKKV